VNGTAAVTVQSGVQPVLTTIEVSPSTATVNVNATKQFNATAKDQDGNVMSGVVINWTSSNVTVGTITDAGELTALVVGTTTVTAANETVNGTASVTVQEEVEPVLTTIEVSPSTATLDISETQEFTATAKDQKGDVMSGVIINWTSSNTTIGTVTPASVTTGDDGTAKTTLTTLVVGTATVTAANGTVNDTASVTVQVAQLNIADLKAEPSTGVNKDNPTTVSATITSGVPLELVAFFAIDTLTHQPKEYMLYLEVMSPLVGGNVYSAKWDATEFDVTNATTSSGTPVFVIKADEWDGITIPYHVVFGNITINATSEQEYAIALFKDDGTLHDLVNIGGESYIVESGNTTFTPFAADATERAYTTNPFELLWRLDPLAAVTLTGEAPDYSISLVKTQVPDGYYTVGLGAVDESENNATDETTISVGPTPTPTPAPRGRGGGGGGGGVPDTDGDGYTDIEEMIMGTDPLDPCDPNPECVACTGAITEVITERPATPTPKLKPTPKPTIAPTTPEPKPEEPEKPPGFEAVFAIAGLLAVAYLALRRKK
jgi:PGF-CTERM protein